MKRLFDLFYAKKKICTCASHFGGFTSSVDALGFFFLAISSKIKKPKKTHQPCNYITINTFGFVRKNISQCTESNKTEYSYFHLLPIQKNIYLLISEIPKAEFSKPTDSTVVYHSHFWEKSHHLIIT